MNQFAYAPSRTVGISDLHQFTRCALECSGVEARQAEITSEALVATDAFGVFTHGTKLLSGYLRRLQAGGIRAAGQPRILSEGPAWALVDGDSALGQVIGVFAMDVAIRKASTAGIGYAGVQNSNHFGAAGHYALQAARANLIGLAMCNDTPSVAAPGSRSAITGTNPIAYAVPASGRDPIFFDAAMSTVAGGKVYASVLLGKPIPGDWLIGPDGRPTADSSLYPDQASLAPMGGHKGYGLALLIEVLSGVLTGAGVTSQVASWMASDPSQPTHHGAAFLAIDCRVIAPMDFEARVLALIDEIHAAAPAEGTESILLPGEREWASRRRAERDGIPLPADVWTKLREASRMAGLDLPAAAN